MHCIPHSHLASDPPHPDLNSASTDETHDHRINETITENAPHVIGIGNQEGKVDVAGKGGEIPAWESCGKVVALERAGYGEFVVSLHISSFSIRRNERYWPYMSDMQANHLALPHPLCYPIPCGCSDDKHPLPHRLPLHSHASSQQARGGPVSGVGGQDWDWWKHRLEECPLRQTKGERRKGGW